MYFHKITIIRKFMCVCGVCVRQRDKERKREYL